MNHVRRFLVTLGLAAAAASAPAASLRADEVRVAVASNFAPVLAKLEPAFERDSGHVLTLVAGATGQHYTQILNGAPFDVLLAADDERPRMLEEAGRAVRGTSFAYAIGRLVLWSASSAVVDTDGAVLASGSFEHLALANPVLAPYGKAAQETLTALGLRDSLQSRLVLGENITQALQFVQTGNAELGFIARSQWLEVDAEGKGSAWEVPAELHAPIVQLAVLVRESEAGRAFLQFLRSDAARATIEAAGYGLP